MSLPAGRATGWIASTSVKFPDRLGDGSLGRDTAAAPSHGMGHLEVSERLPATGSSAKMSVYEGMPSSPLSRLCLKARVDGLSAEVIRLESTAV